MNSPLPAPAPGPSPAQSSAPSPTERRGWGRRLVNVLVALVVIAVAAATFVFSYDGMHAIALLGGMSAQLARYYPGLFDAVIVIACVAAVVLRDGRWWARLWAWLVIIVVLAAIGATDVVHAVHYTLPHRRTEGIVAGAPIAAVLLAFSLLLTMLRQSKARPAAPPAAIEAVPALPPPPRPIALPAAPPIESAPPPVGPPSANVPPPVDVAAPPLGAPAAPYPPTEPTPVIDAANTSEEPPAASAADEEPAPPTVPAPVPPRESRSIRYAGNTPPRRAWEPPSDQPAGPAGTKVKETAGGPQDYWESEEAGPFAGLVYSARDDQEPGPDAEPDGDETGKPKPHPELDDDAPPFATAPFASVPRLNRQRSTPAPPSDEEDD